MANLKDFFRYLLNWEEQRFYQPELCDVVVPEFESAIAAIRQQPRELIHPRYWFNNPRTFIYRLK